MDNQPVPPLIHQMFLTKAGLYCSERLSIDIVHLNQCINLLLPTFNEEEISKEYEKIFGEEVIQNLLRLMILFKELLRNSFLILLQKSFLWKLRFIIYLFFWLVIQIFKEVRLRVNILRI